MDSTTLIFIVIGILVTLGITAAAMLGARKMISGVMSPLLAQQAETKRLLAVGIPCAARVLHVEQTGTSMAVMGEQSYELRFHLEVMPPPSAAYRAGSAPYLAQMVSLVPMLMVPRVQPGCVISVRIDPQDPRKMAFESAVPPAGYPGAATAAHPMPAAYPPAAAVASQGVYSAPQPGYPAAAPWGPR